jgi:hypothetical protein
MPKDMPFTIEKERVSLTEAGQSRCRWIVSREGFGHFLICGRRVQTGSSYCTEHHGRVWRASQERRSSP